MYLHWVLNHATFQYVDRIRCYRFCLSRFRLKLMILNFFATIGSVLGLQVNSELQPPTCWELFVADTLLRLPVQAKRKR